MTGLRLRETPVGEPLFGIWLGKRRDSTPGWYCFGPNGVDWVGTRAQAVALVDSFPPQAIEPRLVAIARIVEERDGSGYLVGREIFSDPGERR